MNNAVVLSLRQAEKHLEAACREADQTCPTRNELAKLRKKLSAILTDIEQGRRQV